MAKFASTFLLLLTLGLGAVGCTKSDSSTTTATAYALAMQMTRVTQSGFNPFIVTVTVTKDGSPAPGQSLQVTIPKGTSTATVDNGDGTYSFTVTPTSTGTYPVTASIGGAVLTRKAVVLDTYMTGVGQPMAIPGDYVNTDGYEDGVTITPDGQYLFVQYGPFYMSGILNYLTICSSNSYSANYDLNTCSGRTNSSLVFNTIGPTSGPYRPGYDTTNIVNGKLRHLPLVTISGVANGIVGFPTMFYGFKRQADGTFAEPFTLAFDDPKNIQGPFGLSFKMNGDGTGIYIVAWNNYLNDPGGDHKPDIYTGSLTFGQNTSMGTVTYSGDTYTAITPNVSLVNFPSQAGVQGNPHLYYDTSGNIKSIWTDDEQVSNDLTVYRLTSGSMTTGAWVKDTLPSVINTSAAESQPFFTGDKLIMRRGNNIAYHAYQPTNGSCASGFTDPTCWGAQTIMIGNNANTAVGQIVTVGEPTIATYNGKKYLYFVYIEVRANAAVTGVADYNADAAFVEIP